MKVPFALGTFIKADGASFAGVVQNGRVWPISTLLPDAPKSLLHVFSEWQSIWPQLKLAVEGASSSSSLAESELTADLPLLPDNLLGAGANYRRHVIELMVDRGVGGVEHLSHEERRSYAEEFMDARAATGKPFIWVGMRSALAGPSAPLILPHDFVQTDWELELAVVIGKPARRVSRVEALDHVAGYTIANDITARELVDRPDAPKMGMDWMACKSAPGFHILGPYITPAYFVGDPQNLQIRLSLNGQTMQDDTTDDMLFDVARLVEFASNYAQLWPGDIIMTGSPAGNGTHYDRFLQPGDLMVGKIEGLLGEQHVRCVAEA